MLRKILTQNLLYLLIVHGCLFSNGFEDYPIALVSYPRSGNTWVRYCLEYLTKRPSFRNGVGDAGLDQLPLLWDNKFFRPIYPADNPITFTCLLDVDFTRPPILKIHCFNHTTSNEIPVVFILRDYKECIIRQNIYYYTPIEALNIEIEKGLLNKPGHYLTLLRSFDLYTGPKHLIYYEDLLDQPECVLRNLLEFLHESDMYMPEFLLGIEQHKNNSLELYKTLGGSFTEGKLEPIHSKKLNRDEWLEIEGRIQSNFPDLWNKYLRRYRYIQ